MFLIISILMKYTVITTFNEAGYKQYGQRMIQTFLKNWPAEVELVAYAENCTVAETVPNLTVRDIATVTDLNNFKQKWHGVPHANGNISADPVRSLRKDADKKFKWDAVRFAHKVYSIFHCVQNIDTDILIWMDADTICHSPITVVDLARLCPEQAELCYFGRYKKFSECGLYSMKLGSNGIQRFLKEFQRVYDDAENGIFLLDEWHDSFVFDSVRTRIPGLVQHNWSGNLGDIRPTKTNSPGEGHPLINSAWGAYLDHLKGKRKNTGRSLPIDLKVVRTEAYWQ